MKHFSSLVWVVLENHGYTTAAQLPSHKYLAEKGTVLSNYKATQHPSGPNYRDMAAGNHWTSAEFIGEEHPTIATATGLPTTVVNFKGAPAERHNPFLDLKTPYVTTNDLGLDHAGSPSLLYVGLDDANNGHSGPLEVADANLMYLILQLDKSKWFNTQFQGKYPALFVVWDEDLSDNPSENHVFAAWYGRGVSEGKEIKDTLNHYSFCRTVTDNYGANPLENAATASSMDGFWL